MNTKYDFNIIKMLFLRHTIYCFKTPYLSHTIYGLATFLICINKHVFAKETQFISDDREMEYFKPDTNELQTSNR
jgi:hypothetical protein